MSGQLPTFGPTYDQARMNLFVDRLEQMLRGCLTNKMELIRHDLDPSLLKHTGILTEPYGGTHQSTYVLGDILYASAADTLSKLAIGVFGQQLRVGPSGIPEWSAVSDTVRMTSGHAISALRCLVMNGTGKAIYADCSNPDHADRVTAMSIQATGAADELFLVLLGGYYFDAGWSWNTEVPIWFNTTGQMTQTPPVYPNVSQIVATPITAQSINFAPVSALL